MQSIRKLRSGQKVPQTWLRNLAGEVVDTDTRASAVAKYLHQVQWKVRHVTSVSGRMPELFQPLSVKEEPFTLEELRRAIRRLKSGKVARKGDCLTLNASRP